MPFDFVATTSLNRFHILLRNQAAKQSRDSTLRETITASIIVQQLSGR